MRVLGARGGASAMRPGDAVYGLGDVLSGGSGARSGASAIRLGDAVCGLGGVLLRVLLPRAPALPFLRRCRRACRRARPAVGLSTLARAHAPTLARTRPPSARCPPPRPPSPSREASRVAPVARPSPLLLCARPASAHAHAPAAFPLPAPVGAAGAGCRRAPCARRRPLGPFGPPPPGALPAGYRRELYRGHHGSRR